MPTETNSLKLISKKNWDNGPKIIGIYLPSILMVSFGRLFSRFRGFCPADLKNRGVPPGQLGANPLLKWIWVGPTTQGPGKAPAIILCLLGMRFGRNLVPAQRFIAL
jgi:hypothetical protein